MSFTIYPAIDLRHGKVVRLTEGVDETTTSYSSDPVAVAEQLWDDGAKALHIVDLDAAFRDGAQRDIISKVANAFGGTVQVGGGVRDDDQVEILLDVGVDRVIIGSAAIEAPDWVERMVAAHGEAIVVGLDARDGIVRTHGWTESGGEKVDDVAQRLIDAGVGEVIFTNIAHDGRLIGPDLDASAALAASGLRVVVSGGVGTVAHVRETYRRRSEGFSGLIIGKALYEGAFSIKQALEVCSG